MVVTKMRRSYPENKCCTRVAPVSGLETEVEISNVFRFFFFFSSARQPPLSPKFLQSEMDDHLDGEELLYILMIFSNLFSIFSW